MHREGVTHDIQTNETAVLDWFDLTCSGTGCYSRTNSGGSGSGSGTTTTLKASTTSVVSKSRASTASTTTTTGTGTGTQVKYGRCRGTEYTVPAVCVAGTTCTYSNAWYSQCLHGHRRGNGKEIKK